MTFGSRLREARDRAKLTQVQLADRSGVDQGNISRMEREKRKNVRVTAATLAALAKALGVDAEWLRGDEPEKPSR